MHNPQEKKLQSSYESILDNSFRKHFPNWDTLSPFDPLKVLAESLCGSLVAIEARQQRLIDTMVDCLPSLLSFNSQHARLPSTWVQLQPADRLKKAHIFQPGESLRFTHEEQSLYAFFPKAFVLEPGAPSLVELEIAEVRSEVVLGTLLGEPWEALPLPEEAVLPPERIRLRFPDEVEMELTRQSNELLRLRNTNPEIFNRSFFYNPARNELILPGSGVCVRDYAGGVHVVADIVCLPKRVLGEAAVLSNDRPRVLAGARPATPGRSATPRENADMYLERFYSTLRALPDRKEASLFPEELALQIPSIDERARSAEVKVNDAKRELTFFILMGGAAERFAPGEEQELLSKVRRWLEDRVPLSFTFDVQPFFRTPIKFFVSGRTTDEVALKVTLNRAIQPAPYGTLRIESPLSVAECEAQAAAFLSNGSRLRIAVGEHGTIVETIRRQPGEQFTLESGKAHREVLSA